MFSIVKHVSAKIIFGMPKQLGNFLNNIEIGKTHPSEAKFPKKSLFLFLDHMFTLSLAVHGGLSVSLPTVQIRRES